MENTIKAYLKAITKHEYTDEEFLKLSKKEGTGASGGLVAAILACFKKT
jgi:glycerate kinase